ncbi:MAG: glycosyl transferase [Novosphingobium sp.]
MLFAPTAQDLREITAMAADLDMPLPRTIPLNLPVLLDRLVPKRMDKMTRLLAWATRLLNCDAILCAERTSTILKRLPGACPKLIHIPHGAGDRAAGFESRFRLFDMVLVAGTKDRNRLIAEGVTTADTCAVAGPIKVASLIDAHKRRSPLFANDRPVLLYNPHFRRPLSSAEAFVRPLVDAVMQDGRYNLIIAPHIRMAKGWTRQQRADWQALAVPDRVLVDLGSSRSVDMTYTLGADLYIGDVSSQVYEFLVHPRPCLFVNAHNADWVGNEDYAMWQFGEVVTPDCDIPAAIDGALRGHDLFRPVQTARARAALDGLDWDETGMPVFTGQHPIKRAADLIESCMGQLSPPPPPPPPPSGEMETVDERELQATFN